MKEVKKETCYISVDTALRYTMSKIGEDWDKLELTQEQYVWVDFMLREYNRLQHFLAAEHAKLAAKQLKERKQNEI
jgi:hypothetical protein